jgi:hypothetical protein
MTTMTDNTATDLIVTQTDADETGIAAVSKFQAVEAQEKDDAALVTTTEVTEDPDAAHALQAGQTEEGEITMTVIVVTGTATATHEETETATVVGVIAKDANAVGPQARGEPELPNPPKTSVIVVQSLSSNWQLD